MASGNIGPEDAAATQIDICHATGHSDKPYRKITIDKSQIVHYQVAPLPPAPTPPQKKHETLPTFKPKP